MNKKGAIELSISTIVIVVIGVTLLVLGLTFVRGIFKKVGGLTDQSFQAGEKLIQDQMSSDQKFYISGITFELESGGSQTIYTGIQNFGDPGKTNSFELKVEPGQNLGKDWFTLPGKMNVKVGERKAFPFVVTVPKGTTPGSTYTFNIIAYKDSQEYDSQAIIVRVASE
ncbi:MAG: hypothetical protein PHG05_00285 [Candidatus Nanoarchaeia archaeon]|nr:hypothetical protein [Candidatus Nanoarchaeia archaeon]